MPCLLPSVTLPAGCCSFGGSDDYYASRGQDLEIEMPVFLEDTLKEEAKTIEYHLPHYGEQGRLPDIKKTLKVKIPPGVSDGQRNFSVKCRYRYLGSEGCLPGCNR